MSSSSTTESRLPPNLETIVRRELDDKALPLFNKFLFSRGQYDRSVTGQFLNIARGVREESWTVRKVATLMSEHQILRLSDRDTEEFSLLYKQLGLQDPDSEFKVRPSVLREGFTSVEVPRFNKEFLRRLRRQIRIHDGIRGVHTTPEALRDFIQTALLDCKLTLARYLFGPDDVFNRILADVRTSSGRVEHRNSPIFEHESRLALKSLPFLEAEVVRRFMDSSKAFWVSDRTSSTMGALVEYPTGTVVLIVNLPGSGLEIEIKRAGLRGAQPLRVIFDPDVKRIPPSHRFQGGCMGWLLRREIDSMSLLAYLFRLIHGSPAPFASAVQQSSVDGLPADSREHSHLRYWTDRTVFGEGYDVMRSALRNSIKAYSREWGRTPPVAETPIGKTGQFISQVLPSQAIFVGTSSYRLDRVAGVLRGGAVEVSAEIRRVAGDSLFGSRNLCERVLEEILGCYSRPPQEHREHSDYLDAAFRVPANRRRAEQSYLSSVRTIGRFRGMLLGVGGYTRGESFVARNVGLKSSWQGGQWRVRIIFMDHDDVHIKSQDPFEPLGFAKGALEDEMHIWGGTVEGRPVCGCVSFLEEIYRIGPELQKEGRRALLEELLRSFHRSRLALTSEVTLRPFFRERYVRGLVAWSRAAGLFLASQSENAEEWEVQAAEVLRAEGGEGMRINTALEAITKSSSLLRRYSPLFLENQRSSDFEVPLALEEPIDDRAELT